MSLVVGRWCLKFLVNSFWFLVKDREDTNTKMWVEVDEIATPAKGRLAMTIHSSLLSLRLCHNSPIIGDKIITIKVNNTLILQDL